MSSYRQTLVLNASPAAVYASLTTPDGLQGWWTRDCDVPGKIGNTIQVRFGKTYKDLQIENLEVSREVQWICTRAYVDLDHVTQKDEWVGTRICFRLEAAASQTTRLEFEHLGLVPSFECYDICTEGWRQFLGSLKKYVETGHGTPFVNSAQTGLNANATAEHEQRS